MSVPSGSNFPSSLDDDTTLFADAVNQVVLTLDGDIGVADTSLIVHEVITDIAIPCFLVFTTGEIVYCEAKSDGAKQFSSLTRNVSGSGAQSHLDEEELRLVHVAQHLNQHKDAIVAIETTLGVDLANVMLDGELTLKGGGELTLDTADTVTITGPGAYAIDTLADASTDDLDTISGGTTGDIIVIQAENAARTVIVQHDVGNIHLKGEQDLPLVDKTQLLMLRYDGTDWVELSAGSDRLVVFGYNLGTGEEAVKVNKYGDIPYLPRIYLLGLYAMADQSGSISIDVRTETFGTIPDSADSIGTSPCFVMSSVQTKSDTTLAGITREQAAGCWRFVVTVAATSIEQVAIIGLGVRV